MSNLRHQLINDQQIFQSAISLPRLISAWTKVRENGGAAGGDNLSIHKIERNYHYHLTHLSQSLRDGSYRPGPLREVSINKPKGGLRKLAIPCVMDRVIQTSVNQLLLPLFDDEMEESSFGYRPGRGVKQAVQRVDYFRREGFSWVLDADIDDFFDSVDHDRLLDRLAESLTNGPLTELIAIWLQAASGNGRGLPQGSPISPLLSNLFLDRADETFEEAGLRLVRFADDFVLLTRNHENAEKAFNLAKRVFATLGLTLDQEKTRIINFDQGFEFLGHLFVRSMVMKSDHSIINKNTADHLLRQVALEDEKKETENQEAQRRELTRKEAGLSAAFKILYVHNIDRRVDIRNTAFSVQQGYGLGTQITWKELIAIPYQEIDRIEIFPGAKITDEALQHAMIHDVRVVWVNGHGEEKGSAIGANTEFGKRHIKQAEFILDKNQSLTFARTIVEARIFNHRSLLRRLNRQRKDTKIVKALLDLRLLKNSLIACQTIEELRGKEGHAASIFWPAYSRMIPNGFKFHKRVRREGYDGVNILLDFTSNLLFRDISIAVERAQLHSGFGILHVTKNKRNSLALDLMEEFRAPLSESVTSYALNNSIIKINHFSKSQNGNWRLKSEGSRLLIQEYERAVERITKHPISNRRGSWRSHMVEQALAFVRQIEDNKTYQSIHLDV